MYRAQFLTSNGVDLGNLFQCYNLNSIQSALDVIRLLNQEGSPLTGRVSYETKEDFSFYSNQIKRVFRSE